MFHVSMPNELNTTQFMGLSVIDGKSSPSISKSFALMVTSDVVALSVLTSWYVF